MFTIAEKPHSQNKAIIKIVGVGGGGCNTIDYMVEHQIEGVELFALNTDAQSLEQSILRQTSPESCLQIGKNITRGLGAGRIVQIGQEAAKEDIEHIRDMLSGADMVFIAAG
ncbi:MAG: cell division protein FtsZ, partial [Candidatus Oxydemutatoraceae bacterium WSBS_2016_MAG_OTU14]